MKFAVTLSLIAVIIAMSTAMPRKRRNSAGVGYGIGDDAAYMVVAGDGYGGDDGANEGYFRYADEEAYDGGYGRKYGDSDDGGYDGDVYDGSYLAGYAK